MSGDGKRKTENKKRKTGNWARTLEGDGGEMGGWRGDHMESRCGLVLLSCIILEQMFLSRVKKEQFGAASGRAGVGVRVAKVDSINR